MPQFMGAFARITLITALAGTGFWLMPATSASANWLGSEKQLTTGSVLKEAPDVSGNRMVYSDYRNQRSVGDPDDPDELFDIRVMNLKTGSDKLLTPKHDAYYNAAMSDDRVVWTSSDGKKFGLWYYNLATGKRTKLPFLGDAYRINGKRMCFTLNHRIWVYDFVSHKRKAVSPASQYAGSCDIYSKTVVWSAYTTATKDDIYSYSLSSKKLTTITTAAGSQDLPRVDHDLIVWMDASLADNDVFVYNLTTKVQTRVPSPSGNQSFPEISAGKVVYEDDRANPVNTQIYLYDVATGIETAATHSTGSSWSADISKGRLVYEDDRTGDIQLYTSTITPPVVTATAIASVPKGIAPSVVGTVRTGGRGFIGSVVVHLDYSTDGKTWKAGNTAVTTFSGSYTVSGPVIVHKTWFRVRFAGNVSLAPAVSARIKVKVT